MSHSLRHSRRLVAWTAAAALGGLALAGTAAAAPGVPTDVSVAPAGPTAAGEVAINWSAPADGDPAVGYEGGFVLDPANDPSGALSPGTVPAPPSDGVWTLKVRAVGADLSVGPYGTATVNIDRTAPDLGAVTINGTLGPGGWYRSPLSFSVACTDANIDPAAACTIPWTTQGSFEANSQPVEIRDQAGNPSATTLPAFAYDSVPPPRTDLIAPGTLVPDQPTFRWFTRSSTADPDRSGIHQFLVQYRSDDDGTWTTVAVVPGGDAGISERTARRGDGLSAEDTPPPFPENREIDWRVRAVDRAGNGTNGSIRQFTIDPTVPPAPDITGGPVGPTRNTTPTFTWNGGGDSFRWDILPAGSQNPIRSGNTAAKEITVGALNDGAYTFRVTQFTAAGRESAEALRSFVVDTTPPSAPLILTRPTFPSVTDAVFTWSTEPGAYSRWSVVDANGGAVVAPTDTPVTSATLPQLADGTYTFQLQQIDAAGNVSPATVEGFTVIAPLVPPPGAGGTVTILPRQNAKRLQPKAGKTLFSRRPVLRWSRGPKGTKLFNLQIFRVTTARGTRTPKVTKILSVFPKSRAYRVPKSKTRPKTCYVWRVWPYTGREFTPKPLGVSNYCIASQKVLTKKARIIAQRKAAKARERALVRSRSR